MSAQFIEGDEFQSDAWKTRMSANGEILQNHGVRQVMLVHGTFAGDNPLGIYDILGSVEQHVTKGPTPVTNKLRSLSKSVVDELGDVGNYLPEYKQALADGLQHGITCDICVWGSGNFHLARLQGTVKLAQRLAENMTSQNIQAGERLLLLGHSHAGQLFALLTTLLEDGDRAKVLLAAVDRSSNLGNKADLLTHLQTIKSVTLDLVTFGTPVRYAWGKGEGANYRLLVIVNHRSASEFTGIPSTRDGDYVQQWGVEGTDLPTFEHELNNELDAVLDEGGNISTFIHSLANHDRRHPHYADGSLVKPSLLINYHDDSPTLLEILPLPGDLTHALKTLFGHGIYTEKKAMLFNIDTIIEHFYR